MWEKIKTRLLNHPGAVEDFKAEWGWQRFLVRDKMFAAICTPDVKYQPYQGRTLLQLKCDPALSELLRGQYPDILPGFYCDKRHWISVYLDGAVPEELLFGLCDASYRLVAEKLPKKVQRELSEGQDVSAL